MKAADRRDTRYKTLLAVGSAVLCIVVLAIIALGYYWAAIRARGN